MLSPTEENYLKCVYKLSEGSNKEVNTNSIAAALQTSAASVSDMLRKLSEKGLLSYIKYKGVHLTNEGKKVARTLVRKHRLWEVFLVDKLNFSWDEVHEIAEQLEHIQSPLLIQRLDSFLGFPKSDPHGDPIPDQHGNYQEIEKVPLAQLTVNATGTVVGVKDHSPEFLQYLDSLSLTLGSQVKILRIISYDNSYIVLVNGSKELSLSAQVARNLLIDRVHK